MLIFFTCFFVYNVEHINIESEIIISVQCSYCTNICIIICAYILYKIN